MKSVICHIRKALRAKQKVTHFNLHSPYSGDHNKHWVEQLQTVLLLFTINYSNGITREEHPDLFRVVPTTDYIFQLVAGELKISVRIATIFNMNFGGVQDLRSKQPKVRNVSSRCVVISHKRVIEFQANLPSDVGHTWVFGWNMLMIQRYKFCYAGSIVEMTSDVHCNDRLQQASHL